MYSKISCQGLQIINNNIQMETSLSTQVFILILTGLLVPSVLKWWETYLDRKREKNKEIRDHQLQLAEQLTKATWKWRFLAKQICYYGIDYKKPGSYQERFQKATSDYENEVWTLFTEVKSLKAASMVWFPLHAAEIIEKLYAYIKGIDSTLTQLVNEANDGIDHSNDFDEWSEKFTEIVSSEIENHTSQLVSLINK